VIDENLEIKTMPPLTTRDRQRGRRNIGKKINPPGFRIIRADQQ